MAKKKKKKQKRLYDELERRGSLLMSEAHIVTMTKELVQQMMITGLPEKSIRSYVKRMDEGDWDWGVNEDVIWDIGEELASDDEEVLANYVQIQEWIHEVEQAVKQYNDLQKLT